MPIIYSIGPREREKEKKKTPKFNQAAFRFVFTPPPPPPPDSPTSHNKHILFTYRATLLDLIRYKSFFILRSTTTAAKGATTTLATLTTTTTTSTHRPGVQSERTTVVSSFTNDQERFRPLFWQLLPPPRCRRVENFLIGARQVRAFQDGRQAVLISNSI